VDVYAADTVSERQPVVRAVTSVILLGIATQLGYNVFYDRYSQAPDRSPILERMARSKWMPLKAIPDDEYESLLKDKIGKLDHEITIVESQIAALRHQRSLIAKHS
jgi:hypothetical protein